MIAPLTQLSLELHFGPTLHRRSVSEQKKRSDLALHVKKTVLFLEVEFFFPKHDYEEKKTTLLHKREPIFKITLQESHFWLSVSQCISGMGTFKSIQIITYKYNERSVKNSNMSCCSLNDRGMSQCPSFKAMDDIPFIRPLRVWVG